MNMKHTIGIVAVIVTMSAQSFAAQPTTIPAKLPQTFAEYKADDAALRKQVADLQKQVDDLKAQLAAAGLTPAAPATEIAIGMSLKDAEAIGTAAGHGTVKARLTGEADDGTKSYTMIIHGTVDQYQGESYKVYNLAVADGKIVSFTVDDKHAPGHSVPAQIRR